MWLFSILAMLLILPALMLLLAMLVLVALAAVLVVAVVEFHLERTIPKTDRAFPAAYAGPDGDCNRGPRN